MGNAKEDFERLAEYYDKKTAESEWILRQLINQPLGKKFISIVSGAKVVMMNMQDLQDNPEYQKNGTDGVQCIYSKDDDEGALCYNKRRTPEDGEYIHQILQLSDIEGKTYAEQKLLAIKRLIESEIEANKVFGVEEDIMDNFYAVHAANIANVHITHPEAVMNPEVDRVSCIYTVYGDKINKEIVASSPHINHTTVRQYEHPVLWLEDQRGRSYEEMKATAEKTIKVGEDIVKMLLKSVNN